MTEFATAMRAARTGARLVRAAYGVPSDRAAGPRREPADRRRLETACEWIAAGGSVLIFGRVGTGKSALLAATAGAAGATRVLRCVAAESRTEVAFSALAELMSTVTAAELRRLPAVHQRILTSVAAGEAATAAEANPATIRHAMLELLRTLTFHGPVLIVVDDLHRLDHATAALLRYIAGRVDGLPIWLLAAESVPVDCPPVGRPLCPQPLLVIPM